MFGNSSHPWRQAPPNRIHARETRGMSDGLDLITSSFSALVYYGAHESKEEDERKRKKGQEGR